MRHRRNRRGFVLILMALMAVVLFACLGMSVDLGRMFIAKHEAQVFTDSGALAAALELNGSKAGAQAATAAVDNSTNKWNLGTQGFSGNAASHQVDFSTSSNGPWISAANVPTNAAGYEYVRVRASVSLPLYFISVLVPLTSTTVSAVSVAGQTAETTVYEGMFPFTPMSFDPVDPTVGFVQGTQYTIRYPASRNAQPCAGDVGIHSRDAADRGYWGDNSASIIRKRIVNDYQSGAVAILGQDIGLVGGAKTSEARWVQERSDQDTDQTSATWDAYMNSAHNGRRLVVMPITDYNTGIALGFASFLLLPSSDYNQTGNSPWCAIYVGPWLQNTQTTPGTTTPGAYLGRLVK